MRLFGGILSAMIIFIYKSNLRHQRCGGQKTRQGTAPSKIKESRFKASFEVGYAQVKPILNALLYHLKRLLGLVSV